jgi:outer membrane biosynthesis protein TonB
MAQEFNAVEQAIARALRDNLERIQRASDELHHAVNDVVSACASNKPTNALPPLLRAQTSAASLTAALEVLSRFVALSLQTGPRSPLEAQITDLVGRVAPEPPPAPQRPAPSQPVPKAAKVAPPPPPAPPAVMEEPEYELQAETEEVELTEPVPPAVEQAYEEEFDVNRLSAEEQELHRRANRVAKVSMQDIKMLRPEQVRLGRQNKDICVRLKDDIEKAHREYDRRFKPIMDHPVDYFYRWMVEILADGDAHALGEYPYATPARHH